MKAIQSSQIQQLDKLYMKYFRHQPTGFFVDVGAYDGINFSNTFMLATAGWGGIFYEPVPEFFNKCKLLYAEDDNIKVLETCIGSYVGYIDMFVAGTISTYDNHHLNLGYWKGSYSNKHKISVRITTLDKSLKENNTTPNFELLSVDVEGAEMDVLNSFDILYWRPQMVIVEAQELHPSKELRYQAKDINEYFDKVGYEKIHCDEINNIYVSKEKRDEVDNRHV